MKMLYCLVYEKMLTIDGGFTKTVGPFKTIEAAQDWHAANTPDHKAAIYLPKGE